VGRGISVAGRVKDAEGRNKIPQGEVSVSRRTKYYFAGLIINGAGRAPNPAGNPG